MRQIPDLLCLPSVMHAHMRPWLDAVENTHLHAGSALIEAAFNTSLTIDRRVVPTSAISEALAEAGSATEVLARKLDCHEAAGAERHTCLTALAMLIEALQRAQPSRSTRALGLRW